jgi:hypothetical protein
MHSIRYLIGLLTLAAASLGAVYLWGLLSRAHELPGMRLRIEFRDARGLRPGADVRCRGVAVGSVAGVQVSADGQKAVVDVVLQDQGGLSGGASGLDTLVRDTYVAFWTPPERGSPLLPGSLVAGAERPPKDQEPDTLAPLLHGDLRMSLLLPENHGIAAGSPVIYRGMQTGDVRSVRLADDGRYVIAELRIASQHRRTVTDQSAFWVARPYVSGALLSGFTVSDVASLVSPFVSYWTPKDRGVPAEDGYRVAAGAIRPDIEAESVPGEALSLQQQPARGSDAPMVLVRVVYEAVERDLLSPDDIVQREGTGLLYVDRSGRAVVLTARSLVDASFTERDWFGTDPDIAREQLKVLLPQGPVLRGHRVWVDPDGGDLAVVILDGAAPDLRGTEPSMLDFRGAPVTAAQLHAARADGHPLVPVPASPEAALADASRGGAAVQDGRVVAIAGQQGEGRGRTGAYASLSAVPEDLRPAAEGR